MKLLNAKKVKIGKSKLETERRERIDKLNEEEGASVKRLNDALAFEDSEHDRIEKDLKTLEKNFIKQKTVARKDLDYLERQKLKALEPVDLLLKEAEEKKEELDQKLEDIKLIGKELAEDREWIVQKTEELSDGQSNNRQRAEEIDRRNDVVERSETEIKRSTGELSKNWLDFHKNSKDIDVRIKEVEGIKRNALNNEQANIVFFKELQKVDQDQKRERVALVDGYNQLQKSRDEILGRKE